MARPGDRAGAGGGAVLRPGSAGLGAGPGPARTAGRRTTRSIGPGPGRKDIRDLLAIADAADALAQAICHGWRGGGTGTDDAADMVSAGGAVRVSARTPAQRQWAAAQAAARRTGAVDPRRVRR